MITAHRRAVLALGTVAFITGCGIFGTFEAEERDDPAEIVFYYDTTDLHVADTVNAGSEFTVRVDTYTGSCTTGLARTDLAVVGRVAEIRPYNRTKTVAGGRCTTDVETLPHNAKIRVDTPGPLTIRVFGSRRTSSSADATVPAQITRVITVR